MAMRVVLGLLQLFVLAVSRGESVHVDSDHASLVSRPSKSCQDHAPLVCPPVTTEHISNNNTAVRSFNPILMTSMKCDNIPSGCSATVLLDSIHYQYVFESATRYSLVLTWDAVNVSDVDNITIMFRFAEDILSCDDFISRSCHWFTIPKESTRLILTGVDVFTSSDLNSIFFRVLAAPVYQWTIIRDPRIKNEVSLHASCNNTAFQCASSPTPPLNLSVNVMTEGAVNVTWSSSSSPGAIYYLYLRNPLEELVFRVEDVCNVILKNLSTAVNHSVKIEEYSCSRGCSNSTTGPVNFTLEAFIIPSTSMDVTVPMDVTSSSVHTTQLMVTNSLYTTTTAQPKPTENASSGAHVVTIAVPVTLICVLLVFALLAAAIAYYRFQRKKKQKKFPQMPAPRQPNTDSSTQLLAPPAPPPPPPQPLPPPAPPTIDTVLVYAPSCLKKDEEKVMLLAHELKQYGLQAVSYDVSYRMDPVQWLEKMTTTANTVICVVNEQFHKSLETPFLRALSLLISADITQQAMNTHGSKFAIVLLRETDRQYIPTGYMESLPVLQYTLQQSQLEDIIRYIQRTPHYEIA